jgi:large subunit ribosomal protein L30
MSAKVKITLRRSPIGYERSHRETARCLGFKKLQQSVVREDTPVVRGMIHKIQHLVEVETVEE